MYKHRTFTQFLHGREWFEFHKGPEPEEPKAAVPPEPPEPARKDDSDDEEVKCGG